MLFNVRICIALCLYLIFTATMVHATIATTWTGVEKKGAELLLIKIRIDSAQTAGRQTVSQPNSTEPVTLQTALLGGIPLNGSISRQRIPINNQGRFVLGEPQLLKIDGRYFPGIGVLGFHFNGAWDEGATILSVLDASGGQMVALYPGAVGRSRVPFVLASGDKLPESIVQLLPYDLDGLRKRQQQVDSDHQAQTDYVQQLMTLNIEMLSANQNGDKQRALALQKQIQQLNRQMIKKRKQQANQQLESLRRQGENGSPQQQLMALQAEMRQAANARDNAKVLELQLKQQKLMLSLHKQVRQPVQQAGCPENIVSWVGEMDLNGASFNEFKGLAQLSNLFRPIVFSAHFGKPFAQMTGAEKSKIAFALQGVCIRKGSKFYTSPNTTSIQSAFSDTACFSSIDAGIGGIALEMIAQWGEYTLAKAEQEWNWQDILLLEYLYAKFLNIIWPDELDIVQARLIETKNTVAYDALAKRLEKWAGEMNKDGINALRKMARIKADPFYQILTKTHQDRADQQVGKIIDRVLPIYLKHSDHSRLVTDDLPGLTRNADWYRTHTDIFAALAGTAAIKQFQKDLGAQRDHAYQKLQQEIESEIKKLDNRNAVISFGKDFVLPLDTAYSPTWRKLERNRIERLAQVEWDVHVARVGKGPFDPHHPGAVYLNALYRNDHAMLKQEDARFAAPFRDFAKPLTQSGIFQLASLFPGGAYEAGNLQRRFETELNNLSMADILAGFFIVSYEHFYPNCMGNAVEVKRTVEWDKVVRDVLNDDPWDVPEAQIYYYNIKADHLGVFKRVGVGKSPEEMEIISSLFGSFFPANLRQSQAGLVTVLRGLRKAMADMPCNDPDMRQLEKNLMQKAQGR